ncbi:DUF1488 domain-containing protein [Vibrio genomosp. F10]|uniref:DUF1488 domain-containing protein n=1 Tax=Vibrio genomosp. F10 TaxID=723171 RepID=UPI000311D83D|nr:DUF1488 domain-containing protein [Vibrio genomosp. F10]OEF03625.1 transcriptional regulator [Vibrio genomosp. F10 str. 9ZD137]
MNQSILFPDMQNWDENLERVSFPAQQAGALIECYISMEQLGKLSAQEVKSPQQALDVFNQYRFDIEEIVEEKIEQEEWTSSGSIDVLL